MSKIEFQSRGGYRDCLYLQIWMLRRSRLFRKYCLAVLLLGVMVTVIYLVSHKVPDGIADYLKLESVIIGALFTPVLARMAIAVALQFVASKRGRVRLFFQADGYGSKTDTGEVFLKWEMIDSIDETEMYFFLTGSDQRSMVIHKYLHPDETMVALKALLLTVPVKKKSFLSEPRQ